MKHFSLFGILLSVILLQGCNSTPKERFADSVAYDAALSWVGSPKHLQGCPDGYDGNTYRYETDLIKSTGVTHIRERLSWPEVCPSEDSCNFGHYLDNAKYCKQQGINISNGIFDAAPYARIDQKLPRDLGAIYDFSKKCAETFGDNIEIWEYWNEEDIFFAPESAWEYSAGLKAASLGWKAAKAKGLFTNGALCREDWDFYNATLFDNEILPYIDIFNIHTYLAPCNYGRIMADLRQFLNKYGVGEMSVVLTECGTNQEGHSIEPSVFEGITKHSEMQETIQKEFCMKSQVLTRMEGVMRNYFFIFGAYSERGGKKDWGLIRRDCTPKPAVNAFAELIREVGEGSLAGEVAVSNEKVRAFRFDMPDKATKIMYWTRSEIDDSNEEITEWKDDPEEASVTLDNGEKIAFSSSRIPKYMTLPSSLPVCKEPAPLGWTGARKTSGKNLEIIMRADLNPEDYRLGRSKSRIELSADSVRFDLEVWNLGDSPQKGIIQNLSTGQIVGLPEELEIPAHGKTVLKLTYRPDNVTSNAIILEGLFSGEKTTRFNVPVFCKAIMSDAEANSKVVELDWRNVNNWTTISSSENQTISWDEQEQAIRVETNWEIGSKGEQDRWLFPEYNLQLPDECIKNASAIRYEIKSLQDKVENDYSSARVYFVTEKKNMDMTVPPPGFDYEINYVDVPESVRNECTRLQFGGHPLGHRHIMWIKNINVIIQDVQ